MKNIFTIILLGAVATLNAQVIIGDATGTATTKTSVLLEFAAGQNKGMILPYVRILGTSPTPGSIILDATTSTNARVKYYNGTWVDISGQGADITTVLTSQPATTVTETADAKTIIGANSSPVTDGVLILESNTKAMVLPTVADVNNIKSPSPGMIVYVNKTGAKRLAVFNGAKWSFWKP